MRAPTAQYAPVPDQDDEDTTGPLALELEDADDVAPRAIPPAKASDADARPIPWRRVVLAYTIVGLDALGLMFVTPFLPSLAREAFQFSEASVGTAVGLMQGAFNLANFSSSFYLGHLSDLHGRRPLILLGLAAATLSVVSFGFSTAFWQAMVNRLLVGALDSNNAVVKAHLTDLVPTRDRARVFAYFGSTFALSRAFASAFSGVLTGIHLPALARYPYALPGLVGCLPLALLLVYCALALPESNPRALGRPAAGPAGAAPRARQPSLLEGMRLVAADALLRRLFLINALHNFANGGLLVALVLFPTLKRSSGGLGFSTLEVGLSYFWFGISGFAFQVACFERCQRRYGIRALYLAGLALFVVASLGISTAALPAARPHDAPLPPPARAATWAVLLFWNALLAVSFMAGLPVLSTMLANAARREIQGLTQGLAQSFASLLRAFGPAASGLAFSLLCSVFRE
eukprot:tig00001130_g7231.t1